MWRIIFQSFWFKLAALFMALFLWFHVATDKVYEYVNSFPLEISHFPERLILSEKIPDHIDVKIQGKGKELLKLLLVEKKTLQIDAREFTRGETNYTIEFKQIPIPEGLELRVVDILPSENLKIWLDYSMEKELKVQPDVKISPAEGFELVGELHYNPAEVTISGPRMWVKGFQEIRTREKVIENAQAPVAEQIELVLPEGYNLALSTPRINFSQNVEKTLKRRISKLAVELINTSQRREYLLQPDSIDVIISGAQSAVEAINPDEIKVTADCTGAKRKEKIKLPLQIKLPAKVNLKGVEPDSVELYTE
jgi:YbbR domain-containing protein